MAAHTGYQPVNPDKYLAGVEKWNSEHEEIDQLHVPAPSEMLNAEFGGVGGEFEIIRFRDGCCFDTSPCYTRDEVCPRPEEVPDGEMIVGFFFLNCTCLVSPLVFMTADAFKKGWSNMLRVAVGGGAFQIHSAHSANKDSKQRSRIRAPPRTITPSRRRALAAKVFSVPLVSASTVHLQ